MTFTSGKLPVLSNEQKKLSKLAWKPSKASRERAKNGPVVSVFKKAA